MTEYLKDWILSIVAVSLVSGGVQALAGSTPSARIIRLIGALLLLLAVLAPLRKNVLPEWDALYQNWDRTYETASAELQSAGAVLYRDAAEEILAQNVEELAMELGVSCQAEIRLAEQEAGLIPISCRIDGPTLTEEQETRLREQIRNMLGDIDLIIGRK